MMEKCASLLLDQATSTSLTSTCWIKPHCKLQQLTAYVSWVNCQLKRKPGLKPITNLRHDLQDGVVLTQLIEIVAGEVLEEVYVAPQNKEESRKNVEQVLQFISSRHIRMPHISARDIVDGNLKSVMRIILALAAHFKPSANHRAASGGGRSLTRSSSSHNPLSPVALAQGAAAALASARHDASQPARAIRLHSSWGSDADKSICVRALVKQYERAAPDDSDNPQSSSLSPLSSPRALASSLSDSQQDDGPQQESSDDSSHVITETALEDSLSETLEKEVQETRKLVSALQALLLHGSLPEDEQDVSFSLDQGTAEQQLVVIRSRLDQSMDEAQQLKREVLRCKQEMRNMQAVKDAQQQRLCTQEASILQMKQELLRASMTKDELNNQNAELQWKMEECNRLWGECKKEVGQKDRLLQQLKHKLEESQKKQTEHNGYSYSGNPAPSVSDGRGKSPRRKGQLTDSETWSSTTVCHTNSGSSASTKILYFTGKSPTPSMINIPKRLGEVTLKDVKAAVDREGNYRYHFKALDPEFGTVKEEVFLDGAIIPGWEGKIVAWVEEDHGEERMIQEAHPDNCSPEAPVDTSKSQHY
ncbi:dixin isoform X7 [Pseudochaenichthys georgianus]|uniref:dixin isoform X7 n=1 Tax=Pseudochaenichthys georgianus TaxID=52239 RepID=UPI00146EA1DA|nr:dixin-A-like isoform X7 [Pseudochaenichthys georgianus]